jgi:hypothetical protein
MCVVFDFELILALKTKKKLAVEGNKTRKRRQGIGRFGEHGSLFAI